MNVQCHVGQFNKKNNVDFHKLCFIHFVIFSFPCDKNWLSLLKLKCRLLFEKHVYNKLFSVVFPNKETMG